MEFFKCSIGGEAYGTGITEIEKEQAQRSGKKLSEGSVMDHIDTVIYERLSNASNDIRKVTREHLEQFGSAGLRYRYADLPLPSGTVKNRPSMVFFGCRRSIEGEKGKKKKRKRRRGEKKEVSPFPAPSSPTRCCPRVVCVPSSSLLVGDFSPVRGDGMSSRVGRKIEAMSPRRCHPFSFS
ncbi:hypothetical protein BHE74_00058843, partial [Ensete ventricosum]